MSGIRRPATLKDVARAAGVSIAAVSYAINGGGSIGEEMRQRIRTVAEQLGYRPNRSAQAIRTGRTHMIGLVVPDLGNPFFPALAQAIEHAARARGYTVVLLDAGNRSDAALEGLAQLAASGVDGLVWCRAAEETDTLDLDLRRPMVLVGPEQPGCDGVTADDHAGARLVASHFRAAGHMQLAYVSAAGSDPLTDLRRLGFLEGLEAGQQLAFEASVDTGEPASLTELWQGLRSAGATAVFCGNDMIAIALMRHLRDIGLRLPEALSVVGFDDIPWSDIVTPPLTTIRQPMKDIGVMAVDMLLARIDDPSLPYRHMKMPVTLTLRQSVSVRS